MGLRHANFATDSYQPKPAQGRTTDSVDSLYYERYTFAHEVGHALGLNDEYMEPLLIPGLGLNAEWYPPILPQFRQYY